MLKDNVCTDCEIDGQRADLFSDCISDMWLSILQVSG